MTTIVVTGRHRPHEVMFLVISALAGAAFMAGAKPPSTVEQLVAPWVLWAWYVLLLVSGVVGLIGIALGDVYRTLVLELAAMHGQATGPVLYGLALLATGKPSAWFAVAFCFGWAVASAWRAWQIWEGVRALRQAEESE